KEKIISLQLRCCLFASKQRLLFESPAIFEGVNIIRMGVNIVRMHICPWQQLFLAARGTMPPLRPWQLLFLAARGTGAFLRPW
ncbi:MAG: hypothetical protein J5951_01990, partial [Bacteroidales bacterium]|nr:hypothetical protein [Bacteroidales bacterium]